ncbi:MAG: transglycosylase [Roseburia sp.]
MQKNGMTGAATMAEAVGFVAACIYLGLQIYCGIAYGVGAAEIAMNVAAMVLVYVGLTLLGRYPERVNGLDRELCSGKVRWYTVHMVLVCKLIFVVSLLFASICDVLGKQINGGYSLVPVVLIVVTAVYCEYRIIQILRSDRKK